MLWPFGRSRHSGSFSVLVISLFELWLLVGVYHYSSLSCLFDFCCWNLIPFKKERFFFGLGCHSISSFSWLNYHFLGFFLLFYDFRDVLGMFKDLLNCFEMLYLSRGSIQTTSLSLRGRCRVHVHTTIPGPHL